MQNASQTDSSPSRPPSFCYVLTVEDFSQTVEDSSRTVSICGSEGGTEQLTFAIAFVHTLGGGGGGGGLGVITGCIFC